VHARSCIFVRFCPSKFEKMYEIDDEIWGRKIPGFHTASLFLQCGDFSSNKCDGGVFFDVYALGGGYTNALVFVWLYVERDVKKLAL